MLDLDLQNRKVAWSASTECFNTGALALVQPEGKLKLAQVRNAASHIASPRTDGVFVGQRLSVVRCPPASMCLGTGSDACKKPDRRTLFFSAGGGERGTSLKVNVTSLKERSKKRKTRKEKKGRRGACVG